MPRLSSNPRGKFQPRTVEQLLALTKQRAIDRPAQRRTWDKATSYFVIQDPFDYHIVRLAGFSLSADALISTFYARTILGALARNSCDGLVRHCACSPNP